MDFIDMCVDSSDEYLTAYYYDRRPASVEDGRVTFTYKQHNPHSRIFETVLGNVRSDKATYAISTNDDYDFRVGAYIHTQNGFYWEIVEVVKNEQTKKNNDVLRWFTRAVNTETNVRMIQVDDLFDQATAYETNCIVRITFNKGIASFTAKESLSNKDIASWEYNGAYVFETAKNLAVSIVVTLEDGREKKIQIPSYRLTGNELVAKYDI